MNWNKWVRQIHRWVSIAFTVTVIANFIALAKGQPPAWVTYSPLLPLGLLLLTGLYMFVLPYATKWRSGRVGTRLPSRDETTDPGAVAAPGARMSP